MHTFRFDIISFSFKGEEDEKGIIQTRDEVNKLIDQEIDAGIPPNRIVLGGFSQGGAMTLATGLTTPHKLAGLTVLSGWFAIRQKIGGVCSVDPVLFPESLTPLCSFSGNTQPRFPSSGVTGRMTHWSRRRSESYPGMNLGKLE